MTSFKKPCSAIRSGIGFFAVFWFWMLWSSGGWFASSNLSTLQLVWLDCGFDDSLAAFVSAGFVSTIQLLAPVFLILVSAVWSFGFGLSS
ncbi:hypothetical protein [Candidatus Similichlamydia laticola]|uniref:Uncharacterized protein n=1 Tax=Candidatus Similichlamydia laticola TaxID=2170265 RepID=A0A369KK52_9BACT|nr:hypothetical protein [Candidatus Similichlamydia laticola]RDB31376.1 hypothetical protein HAT2_00519 [Candidatus Similichlamydia laticola]